MLKTIIRKLFSFRKGLSGFSFPWKGLLRKASRTGRYYRSIDEMPLSVFISIICTDNLQNMVQEGSVPEEVLQSTWDEIMEQYLDETFSDEDRHLVQLIASANLLQFNITKAQAIRRYLYFRHDDEMIEILRKMGATDGAYPSQGTAHAKSAWMKRVVAKIKKWQHTLKEMTAEIRRIQPDIDSENIPKISRKYFDDILTKLSQHYHYHVDEEKITVNRYLSMLNDYKQYLVSLRHQANKTT
jgi:hypothetical protein